MKKQLTATVISAKMQKTVKVQVIRKWAHPVYKKIITKKKNYLVHNEKLDLKPGDKVIIEETKPISKKKTWQIESKV
ncbi:MAG: 30S ribosomal protein S17 [Candidatus Beckwithbacteria bacterium]|nr:30S ribosomal protein S17 [Patescibacteria group bacterium]